MDAYSTLLDERQMNSAFWVNFIRRMIFCHQCRMYVPVEKRKDNVVFLTLHILQTKKGNHPELSVPKEQNGIGEARKDKLH